MQRSAKIAQHLIPGLLVMALVSSGRPCAAQEVESPGGAERNTGSVVAPSTYLGLVTPLSHQIGLRLYGWYIGDLKVPGVTAELPIRTTKWLTITPGYQYMQISSSGIDNYLEQPIGIGETYREHQFRVDGTFKFSIHGLEVSDRNMYVRRLRPAWVGQDIDRYRNRLGVAHPLRVMGETWKPFASFEAYFDEGASGSIRNRTWVGVNIPLQKQLLFQPGYVWDDNKTPGLRDVNYLLFALIVTPK